MELALSRQAFGLAVKPHHSRDFLRYLDHGCEVYAHTALCSKNRAINPSKSREQQAADEHRDGEFFEPVGCARCAQTGFRGRIAVQEVMTVSDGIESLILDRASSTEIAALALAEGMVNLRGDGFAKVGAGLTSIEEILRVVA